MTVRVGLDEDFHVHSTFSDGASTLAENVAAARDRGLRTLCLVDHVRQDTRSGALVEVNEKWSCPAPRTVAALAAAGVPLVAGSDSHHSRDIGRYDSVAATVSEREGRGAAWTEKRQARNERGRDEGRPCNEEASGRRAGPRERANK